MNGSVTKLGKELSPNLYTWDEETLTFSTIHGNLVLDFNELQYVTFKTGSFCTFKTSHNCTFETGHSCVFYTDFNCTFKTGNNCTFDTGDACTFETGANCTFDVNNGCTFKTGFGCIIINRATNEVIRLNNEVNYYNSGDRRVDFELKNINVFKNNNKLTYNLSIQTEDIEELKQFLPKEKYENLLREVFDKLT